MLGVIDRLLYPLLKVDDLIVHKILVYLHLFLEISHLSLVDELENPRACVLNSVDALFFEVQNLQPDLSLERPVRLIVDILALQVEQFGLRFGEL